MEDKDIDRQLQERREQRLTEGFSIANAFCKEHDIPSGGRGIVYDLMDRIMELEAELEVWRNAENPSYHSWNMDEELPS